MDTTVKEKPIRLGELQDYARELANRGIVSEGTCSTAADTAAKTVTLGTTFKFESGATFLVKFTNAVSVASSTLAVTHTDPDGVTTTETAKPIYYRGAALPANKVSAGDNLILRYDGTSYNVIGTLAQDFTETDPVFSASAAAGIALGQKIKGESSFTYLIVGDGESQEGQIWEMAEFASTHKLGNLIAFTDFNRMQLDGYTKDVINMDNIDTRWLGFNWHVQRINGHDFTQLDYAIQQAKLAKDRPSMIICDTVKSWGYKPGVGVTANHSMAVSEEDAKAAIAALEGGCV